MTTLISLYDDSSKVVAFERVSATKRITKTYNLPTYFYVEDKNGEHNSIYQHLKFDKVECGNVMDYRKLVASNKKKGKLLHETDISFVDKVLLDSYIDAKPDVPLNVCLFDIEVDYVSEEGFPYAHEAKYPINAITMYFSHRNKFVCIGLPPDGKDYEWPKLIEKIKAERGIDVDIEMYPNEHELLFRMCDLLRNTDIISGWNSALFDITYIINRLKLYKLEDKICFDKTKPPTSREFEIFEGKTEYTYDIYGRVHLDYLELFRKFTYQERQSYSLDSVCQDEVGLNKIEYSMPLDQLYKKDFNTFIEYNIYDVILLHALDKKFNLINLAIHYAFECCASLKSVLGAVKITEAWINKFIRNSNIIIPDKLQVYGLEEFEGKAEGAIVLQPKRGLHTWMAIVDVNSLYPSVIRNINMSPETIIGWFSNHEDDYLKIIDQTDDVLIFNTFVNGARTEAVSGTAKEFYEFCTNNKYALSPFGVIFNQNFDGVIPKVLADGYAKRKAMQRKKVEYEKLYAESKDPEHKAMAESYDRQQLIQKIALNSLYGVLLNKHSVYYSNLMGSSVTGGGRRITKLMGEFVHSLLSGGKKAEIKKVTKIVKNKPEESYHIDSDIVIYGDTDSIQFTLHKFVKDNNLDQACKLADMVADKINDYLPIVTTTQFLVQDSFKEMIKVGRELVSDRGIYYTRKKYVLRVLDLEGKRIDKFKSMGTDEKKTNNPKKIQGFLRTCFDMILRQGDKEKEINSYVRDVRKDIRTNIFDYGMPKSINKIEMYSGKLLTVYINTLISTSMLDIREEIEDNELPYIDMIVYGVAHKLQLLKTNEEVVTVYKNHDSFKQIPIERIKILHNFIYRDTKENLFDQSVICIQKLKCTLPGHARAAFNHNLMLLIFNDKETPIITSGNKIKVFYLKTNNAYGIKNIAFTTDTEVLPEWFIDNFEVDIFKMMTPLVDKKVDIYLNSLGWHIENEAMGALRDVFTFDEIENEEIIEDKTTEESEDYEEDIEQFEMNL